ncbi:MAG: glycoside hydrolase family 16 protein [Fibrobacter sp.]|nr:glycoside hydrolase family 16 protein [Fibrobacter sp.]
MFKKIGISFIGVAVAGAMFAACSSDENGAGPAEIPESSSDAIVAQSSSDVISAQSSSSSAVTPDSSSAVIPDSVGDHLSSSSVAVIPSSSSAVIPGLTGDLLWSDEFEGTGLDLSKWRYETGNTGWGNNELQYYTNRTDNAYVADGVLHIAAKKESYEGANYTSARLITKGKFDFTYGTVEARIALPVGKGIWPAFWMLGANIDNAIWPLCGEIDIIEAVNDESVVYGTHHWSHEGQHAEYGNNTKDYYGTSYDLDITKFHNYKMTWDKNAITMYVDDFLYQKIDITLEKDAAGNNIASDMGTFHKPFFFILNVAVGGNWPGFEIDDSQFPNEMLVDYIRVYK